MRLSIRNQLTGTVEAITKGEAMATVRVKLDGSEQVLTSAISLAACEDLELVPGKHVTLLAKSTDVAIAVD